MLDRSKFCVQQITPRLWKLHFLELVILAGKCSVYNIMTSCVGVIMRVRLRTLRLNVIYTSQNRPSCLTWIVYGEFEKLKNALVTNVRIFVYQHDIY